MSDLNTRQECRENALKHRQTHDWFSHDSPGVSTTSSSSSNSHNGSRIQTPARSTAAAGLSSSAASHQPAQSPRGKNCSNQRESEAWFDYSPAGTDSSRPSTGSAPVGPARIHGSSDWYQHDAGSPAGGARAGIRTDDGIGCSKSKFRKKPTTVPGGKDPNDWYKHDHRAADGSAENQALSPARTGKKVSPSKAAGSVTSRDGEGSLWFGGDGHLAPGDTGDNLPSPKSKVLTPEAETYYRRDKTGSSSDWFAHDHPPGSEPADHPASHHSSVGAGSAESQQIAAKLKTESGDWFSHYEADGRLRAPPEPSVPVVRQETAGSEMKQVLRINENLSAQGPSSPRSPSGGLGSPRGTGTAQQHTENLMEKFLRLETSGSG